MLCKQESWNLTPTRPVTIIVNRSAKKFKGGNCFRHVDASAVRSCAVASLPYDTETLLDLVLRFKITFFLTMTWSDLWLFFLLFFHCFFAPSAPDTYISGVNNTMCIRTHASTKLHRPKVLDAGINPFTAQPVKCPGWKMKGRACKQYILRSCNYLLSTLCVLMKILSHTGAKKKKKRLKGFRFRTFIGRFHLVISWG